MKNSLILVLITASLVAGQQTAPSAGSTRLSPKSQLGWFLFESPLLSINKDISCASCHDPMRSFTDGEKESKGVLGVRIARNSPTLYGLGHVPGFPDPRLERGGGGDVHAMGLEERCLAPISNPQEMGSSVMDAIGNLRKVKGMARRFDDAFGKTGPGITKDRLGEALAAYLRANEAPPSPYRDYLLGNPSALTLEESEGLRIFEGKGRCSSCHSGPGLSDGLMHVAFGGRRGLANLRNNGAQRRNQLVHRLKQITGTKRRAPRRPRSNNGRTTPSVTMSSSKARKLLDAINRQARTGTVYYGPQAIERQTLPLWDVARTAPYFRDGYATDLEQAVKGHMATLRSIASSPAEVAATLKRMQQGGVRSPASLRPKGERASPAQLSPREFDRLMSFLHALSPRNGSHHRNVRKADD